MVTIDDLQERVAKLELIVRARTHRTLGCLCERCAEGEYDTARVVEDLRAANSRLLDALCGIENSPPAELPRDTGPWAHNLIQQMERMAREARQREEGGPR